MTKHFQNEIEKLKKKILHLASLSEDAVIRAVKAASERDVELADDVINSDPTIDSLEIEVEEECLKILALHQPVAADLRYVVAVLKINSDLERIADLATNIAKRAVTLSQFEEKSSPFDLSSMLRITVGMVRWSVDSLVRQDAQLAQKVRLEDDRVDDLHETAYQAVTDKLQEYPKKATYLTNLLSISRNLERIADHATNIAEDVIYMIDGEIVRHSGGK